MLSAGTTSTATNPECVSVDRRVGAEIPVGGRSEDLGKGRICVYACDCCVNQSLMSEVPTFKGRKMGQKVSRQIKAKVASRRLRKPRGSKTTDTKEEERQEL